jgi:hypothetical protein
LKATPFQDVPIKDIVEALSGSWTVFEKVTSDSPSGYLVIRSHGIGKVPVLTPELVTEVTEGASFIEVINLETGLRYSGETSKWENL